MKVFYITYGSEGHVHVGGWSKVIAPTERDARRLWEMCYPNEVDEHGYMKFCGCYSEEEFSKTKMVKDGNFGAFCWEVIELRKKVLINAD